MKTILILMDSLNRHMLSIYNPDTWVKTPNINRLAKRCIIFDNHWVGSAPCMPARRDIFTGRLNFLERNWGPIEPFDITLQEKLKERNIFSHIVTDHHHYFEVGGENYCFLFDSYDFQRGQEYDPWVSRVIKPEHEEPFYGISHKQYALNKRKFVHEKDFSGPRTFSSACDWLKDNRDAEDFFLMVEAFDPHEPFDFPEEYLSQYNDDYSGPKYNSSSYAPVTEPPDAIEHLKKCYAANLTFIDSWLGKLLDTLDSCSLWEDTIVIFTTDHGHLLGEHGFTGKNIMHMYNELSHIPLMIHLPGSEMAGKRVGAITQNIDLMPTILDYYGIEVPEAVRGKSLQGLMEGNENCVRQAAIYGYHGKTVNVTDGKYTYFRSPISSSNKPCYIYTAMPTTLKRYMGRKCTDEIEMGRFLKYTDYPVYKFPASAAEWGLRIKFLKDTLLFDIEKDYEQTHPIEDMILHKRMEAILKQLLQEHDAPEEQFERLGLFGINVGGGYE